MKYEQKLLRLSAVILICTLLLRLFGSGALSSALDLVRLPGLHTLLLYLETGRIVCIPSLPEPPTEPAVPETSGPVQQPTEPERLQAVFSPEDAQSILINSYCGYAVDAEALLSEPLDWDLTQDAPSVLIVHTHTSESYENTEGYTPVSEYHTLDSACNMLSVGAALTQALEAEGIQVLHDTTVHDYPSFNGAYEHARQTIAEYLQQYPSIQLVLDLHRDAFADSNGKQLGTAVELDGQRAARLMLVLGTDAGGLHHPNWQKNAALAAKLYAQLEKQAPGICRSLGLTSQRYNQDLSAGLLLIEVGAAGNTRQEALLSMNYLAQAIVDLAYGTA